MFSLQRKTKFIPFDLALDLVEINSDESLEQTDKVIKLGTRVWDDFMTNADEIEARSKELADLMESIYSVINKSDSNKKPANATSTGRLYSFSEDADAIFASFMAIRINLHDEIGKMSWEDFVATMFNLPKDSAFMERIRIRQINPADYPPEEQSKIMQAQAAVALKPTAAEKQSMDDVLGDVFASW